MADYIIIDGDTVQFMPSFPPAIVVPVPGTIAGSGKSNVAGKAACVDGDEKDVQVMGCMYISPPYVIPGTGTLKIESLAGDQVASKTKSGGTEVILKGNQFNAVFEVMAPAMIPPPASVPDSMTKYSGGKGMFISTNMAVKGT